MRGKQRGYNFAMGSMTLRNKYRGGLLLGAIFIIIIISAGCGDNSTGSDGNPPIIDSITVNTTFIIPGDEIQLAAYAHHPEGKALYYKWTTYPRVGKFVDDTSRVTTFQVATILDAGMSIKLNLRVSDGKDSTIGEKWIYLDSGSTISGNVYYPLTKIPISDVIITVWDRVDTTDADGFYQLKNMPVGDYSIEAVGDGLDNYSDSIEVFQSITNDFYMTGASHVATLWGTMTTVDETPLEKVRVTVLNPDSTESGLTAETNSEGYYTILNVPRGNRGLLMKDGGNPDYDMLTKMVYFDIMNSGAAFNYIIKIRRTAFESDGILSSGKWRFTKYGTSAGWIMDTTGDCFHFDFCTLEDIGKVVMSPSVSIPTDVGAVYWVCEMGLDDAATGIIFTVSGTEMANESIGTGTRTVRRDEEIGIPLVYMAGRDLGIEIYVWAQRSGICGSVCFSYFRIDYYR